MDWSDPDARFALFSLVLVAWSLLRLRQAYFVGLKIWPGKGTPENDMFLVISAMLLFAGVQLLENVVDGLLPSVRPFDRLPEILGIGFAVLAGDLGLQPLSTTSVRDNVVYLATAKNALEGFAALLLVIRLRHAAYQRSLRRKAK